MDLIANEQSAMANVLKTAEKPGSLRRILRGRFQAHRRENGAILGIFGCRGQFYPGEVVGRPRGPSPGNGGDVWGRI